MIGRHLQRAQPAEVLPVWRQHSAPHTIQGQARQAAQVCKGGRSSCGLQLKSHGDRFHSTTHDEQPATSAMHLSPAPLLMAGSTFAALQSLLSQHGCYCSTCYTGLIVTAQAGIVGTWRIQACSTHRLGPRHCADGIVTGRASGNLELPQPGGT